ncbi:MAG: TetR/AcrR family transcriptional regulator [Cyclobacteriaceae bacterium]|nr:TetR/AcrR family transcriptional regulator [Cyclobacteriaceae bacterium]
MVELLSKVSIRVNEKVYLKDPESSELGRKIVTRSIDLIDEMGFESFTFRKLGMEIGSTEASIYRYFESKHRLLLYLTSWYWGWMEYRLVFTLANIPSARERLRLAIGLLTDQVTEDSDFSHINEVKLSRIVIAESSKAYLTREVDQENKEGAFLGYKKLVARISTIIMEINPDFRYPHMLVSTVIEGANHQRYFADHLPRLTNVIEGEDSIAEFYKQMVFNTINP